MLRKKMIRDIIKNKVQFITIFLMFTIGIMCYSGIRAYIDCLQNSEEKFYSENNLQDVNVVGTSFSYEDVTNIKSIDNVNDAERRLEAQVNNAEDDTKSFLLTVLESNNISKFFVDDGENFSNVSGVWIDKFYADENNLKVGDTISFKYNNYTWNEVIKGVVYTPDHLFFSNSFQYTSGHENFGFIYISYVEMEDYITKDVIDNLSTTYNENVTLENLDEYYPNFDYRNNIPYNYILVDVNNKENVGNVKTAIEENIDSVKTLLNIEDTMSYSQFHNQQDSAEPFVGIFSGIFLVIAILSLSVTMTRIIKKQKVEIGTLKALGFSKLKISLHYVSFGFYISLIGAIVGILLGRFFLANFLFNSVLAFFEIPYGVFKIESSTYIVSLIAILIISFITFMSCHKELKKNAVENLRFDVSNTKGSNLNLTNKGIFKKLKFSTKWNIRDILRNKFRTITQVIGVACCCVLVISALTIKDTNNEIIRFIFDDLYDFDYVLTLKDDISSEETLTLTNIYGDSTSQVISIEIKDENNNKNTSAIFVDDTKGARKITNVDDEIMELDNDEGIYVQWGTAKEKNYEIGDEISWHILGNDTYYVSRIVGFCKYSASEITVSKNYIESLGIDYIPDNIYSKYNFIDYENETIENVELIESKVSLKEKNIESMSVNTSTIIIILFFAVILGVVVIYNIGILSYSEKIYQFSTLKVLGFDNKKLRKIFVMQNNWLCIIAIIIGLPLGFYVADYLVKSSSNYEYTATVYLSSYLIAAIGTFLVSYLVSRLLSKKIESVDMVTSLKGNE